MGGWGEDLKSKRKAYKVTNVVDRGSASAQEDVQKRKGGKGRQVLGGRQAHLEGGD